jgi:hypothetical protein
MGLGDKCVMMAYSSCRYGVSRERVRQLETAAMRKLQIASREHGLDCYRQSLL